MSFKAFSRGSNDNNPLSIKPKRSQSALEYMMTYGWAILIIVIVAVILYSMGIFNPSSSVTTTSTGFSPFIVSSAICNAEGLSLSISTGPLPNTATSVTFNKVYITSSSGTNSLNNKVYPINQITLTSGKSTILRLPVICSSPGNKFSLSSDIEYSYSTTAGNVVTNATGTISGTASSNVNEIADFSNGGVMVNTPKPNNWTKGYTFSVWAEYPGRSFCGYGLGIEEGTSQDVPRGGEVLMCSSSNFPYAETINSSAYDYGSGVLPTSLKNFTWYLLTGVYNPANDNISLYVNGVLATSGSDYATPSSFTPSGNLYNYIIGGVHNPDFYGNLSDAQAYNVPLSSYQIMELYKEGLHGAPVTTKGLVGWWPLDGNANDYSGYNNNGIPTNVNWVSP